VAPIKREEGNQEEESKELNTNSKYKLERHEVASQNQGMELTTYLSKQYSFNTLFGDLLIQKRGMTG